MVATYTYKARDKKGELLTASIQVNSEAEAVASLRSLGYSVISIRKQSEFFDKFTAIWHTLRRSHQHEVVFFSRQLAVLLKAGIPITTALSSIAEQTKDKTLRSAIETVLKDIHSGVTFSDALARHPDIFSEVFVSMVRVGEVAGILDSVLDRVAQLNERELEVKTRVKSAMTYPMILVAVALVVVSFLLINIVPKFVVIFETYQTRLPLATRILLGLSLLVRQLWFISIPVIIIAYIVLKGYLNTEKGRYRFDRFLLHVPIFGQLYLKVIISRLCRTLGAMVQSGVSILEALYVTGKTINNRVVRGVIENVHSSISEGQPLSEPFRTSGIFPSTVVQMISLGEMSGKLDQMLVEVASFYDQEVDYAIKNMTTALEPILLLGMGTMVAFIALSVLLPIFNLVKVLRH